MQRTLISLAVVAALGLAAPFAANAAEKAAQVTTQLPRNAAPTHYALSITPDAASSSFSASVTIALNVKQATSSLTLNAVELQFSAAAISAGPGKAVQAASKIDVDDKNQTATFHFAEALKPGSYQLKLDYTGKIGDQPSGLFSLDYENDGAKKRALYTQFEAADARRVIPSWDEPSYKATFALEATIPAGQMAVSNMPVASTTKLADGRELVRFATSPKMSTYLMFFGLGEFERASAVEGGVEVGVVTQKGHAAQAQFALDSTRAVLKEYNDYFGVKYPLPKLDNIGAPGRSQSFGAMENWGAIFTFEYAMLLDPRVSTQSDKETTFSFAAHEIAHQWFGDLVTMSWWDDLWLNEGFASWMESRTTNRLHPEWNWKLRGVASREKAMDRDALATTHPVVQRISSAEEVGQAFDAITYEKGSAVIHMLEDYVGEDAWRAGVRSYMAKHAYGNTVSRDLWSAVEKAAHKPVVAIAHDFTLQPGVPLVSVADAVCKNGKTTIQLTQGEFSKDQENKKPLSWRVPVIAQTVGNATARTVINGGKATLTLPGCGAVLVNAGQSGYYRALYAPKAFAALADSFAQLAAIDQLGLLGDSWALGLAGRMPASGFLELAKRAPLDAAPEVWQQIAQTLAGLRDDYNDKPEQRAALDRFTRARLAPVLARVGWNAAKDEAPTVANLRVTLISALGKAGDEAVLAEARRLYAASLKDQNALPAALRRPVLGVIGAYADEATWNQLRAAAKAEPSATTKDELYGYLAAARDDKLAKRTLDLALTDEPGATLGAAIISKVAVRHPDLTFDFAMANLAQLEQKVESATRSFYFPHLGSRSADPAMIGKLQAYAQQHLTANTSGDAKTSIASVEYRIKVRSKRLPQIDAWLAQHAG